MSERARPTVTGIDHVQLAMPAGGEGLAESFFAGLLGLERVEKPAALAVRGGCWFRSSTVEVHLGVEEPFTPARKAHVALRVSGYDALVADLEAAGYPVTPSDEVPDVVRCHVSDPFGNRIELISDDASAEPQPRRG